MTQVLQLSSWWKKFLLSSLISNKQLFFVSGRISPHSLEMFSISPLQAYSFRCWFSNNSVITFLEGCFPSSFVAEVGIFSSIYYSNDLSSILSSGGIVMLLFSLIISNCEDHVLFLLIHLSRVLSEFVLPCSLFISFQPEWFQFLLVHCTRHS